MAEEDKRKTVIDILCSSFDKNTSVNYTIKQDSQREERLKELMNYSFLIAKKFGEIFLSKDLAGCALVLYPEKKKTTISSLWLDLNLVFNVIGFSRIGKIISKEKKIKENHPSGGYMHLWFIGVTPQEQGKGVGSALLQQIIRKSEILKKPIYLETSNPGNLEFYKKMGFEVFKEINVGYKLFLLRR